jgi:hypothetical protein
MCQLPAQRAWFDAIRVAAEKAERNAAAEAAVAAP